MARENGTMGSNELHRTVGVLTQCFWLQTPTKKKENKTTKGATKFHVMTWPAFGLIVWPVI